MSLNTLICGIPSYFPFYRFQSTGLFGYSTGHPNNPVEVGGVDVYDIPISHIQYSEHDVIKTSNVSWMERNHVNAESLLRDLPLLTTGCFLRFGGSLNSCTSPDDYSGQINDSDSVDYDTDESYDLEYMREISGRWSIDSDKFRTEFGFPYYEG